MFEWDDAKRRSNRAKHGVDFEDVWEMEWETALHIPDEREDYGEKRLTALVYWKERLYVCAYTLRSDSRRIISLRKANKKERDYYEEEIEIQAFDE